MIEVLDLMKIKLKRILKDPSNDAKIEEGFKAILDYYKSSFSKR